MINMIIKPKPGDSGYGGHISDAVLASWFENARSPILRIFSPENKAEHTAFPLINSSTEYNHIDRIDHRYKVEICSWISHIGVYSFTVYQEARQDGPDSRSGLCVSCSAVMTHYDFGDNKHTPLPQNKKNRLKEFLIEG